MHGLESSLATCGFTVLGRATAIELAAIVRTAFDPAARGEVQRAVALHDADLLGDGPLEVGLSWSSAGPMGALKAWDQHRHDTGVSVTWGWQEAPRQQVTSGMLARLLSPAGSSSASVIYRPLSAGDAPRVLEAQVNADVFRDAYRRAQKRDESARDTADRHRAQRAAAEETQGAGVVLMSLYVSATVTDAEHLAEAASEVESRADQSKIQLRRLYGGQAAGFALTLACGTV